MSGREDRIGNFRRGPLGVDDGRPEVSTKLNELGITNGGIVDAPYGSALSFRDPDNIALEFFAPPGWA